MFMLAIFKKTLWSKDLTSWYLFDFANSFIYINLTVYFSQWIVVDKGLADFWYSLPFVLATIILIFVSSWAGHKGDISGNHSSLFIKLILGTAVCAVGIFMAGRYVEGLAGAVTALIFFGILQLCYQLTFVPYSAFIKHIAPEDVYGKASGIGYFFGQAGSIVGVLATLPFATGTVTLFGTDRLAVMPLAMLLFLVFALPSIIVFRKRRFVPFVNTTPETKVLTAFVRHLSESRRHPGVFRLLISYYFFSDAILTISLYSAIYLEKAFGIADSAKVTIFIIILATMAVGALLAGVLADRYSKRKILIISLIINALTVVVISFYKSPESISVIFGLFGFSMGAVYATSRSYLTSLIPKSESGKFFGLYTFAERFSSVVGPLTWSLVVWLMSVYAPLNYRVAVFVMGLFIILAVFPMLRHMPDQYLES